MKFKTGDRVVIVTLPPNNQGEFKLGQVCTVLKYNAEDKFLVLCGQERNGGLYEHRFRLATPLDEALS